MSPTTKGRGIRGSIESISEPTDDEMPLLVPMPRPQNPEQVLAEDNISEYEDSQTIDNKWESNPPPTSQAAAASFTRPPEGGIYPAVLEERRQLKGAPSTESVANLRRSASSSQGKSSSQQQWLQWLDELQTLMAEPIYNQEDELLCFWKCRK